MNALYQNLTVGETYTTGQVLNIMLSVPHVNHGGWVGRLGADRNLTYDRGQIFSKRFMKKCRAINWQSKITGQDGLSFERTNDGKWELRHYALCLL